MKFTHARTVRQLLHIGSRSATHIQDKQNGEKRRRTRFVPVKRSESPSPSRTFEGLLGFEAIHNQSGSWTECQDPNQLGRYLCRQRKLRRRYRAQGQRRGRPALITRYIKAPIKVHTVSAHPAVSDYFARAIAAGDDVEHTFRAVVRRFVSNAKAMFEGRRYLLAIAAHTDTSDLHVDLVVSTNCPEGGKLAGGLGQVGPWCVAVDRQISSRAQINPRKLAQYKRSVANFRHRHGEDAKPFDVQLARAFDEAACAILGEQLRPHIEAYAASVPQLERAHAKAGLEEIDRLRTILAFEAGELGPLGEQLDLTPFL